MVLLAMCLSVEIMFKVALAQQYSLMNQITEGNGFVSYVFVCRNNVQSSLSTNLLVQKRLSLALWG